MRMFNYLNPYGQCRKVRLKDGTVWRSFVEAYGYLLLKKDEIVFEYDQPYPPAPSGQNLGNCRYDFYIPAQNRYIETTTKDVFYDNHFITTFSKCDQRFITKVKFITVSIRKT